MTLSKSSENSEGLITSSVSTTIGRDLVAKEDMAVCSLEMPGFDVHMKEEVPVLEDESKFRLTTIIVPNFLPPQFLKFTSRCLRTASNQRRRTML